jgi:hypothetical protein
MLAHKRIDPGSPELSTRPVGVTGAAHDEVAKLGRKTGGDEDPNGYDETNGSPAPLALIPRSPLQPDNFKPHSQGLNWSDAEEFAGSVSCSCHLGWVLTFATPRGQPRFGSYDVFRRLHL